MSIRLSPILEGSIKKKMSGESTYIKRNEIDIMNNINDSTFNLHNSLLDDDNRYMKVTLKSKQIGVAGLLNSADYHEL